MPPPTARPCAASPKATAWSGAGPSRDQLAPPSELRHSSCEHVPFVHAPTIAQATRDGATATHVTGPGRRARTVLVRPPSVVADIVPG